MPYLGRSTDGFGVRNRFFFTASAGDTSVSGNDANGRTLQFVDGLYADVYLNGVLLDPNVDYNTSTANTVAGLSALSANDRLEIIAYDTFTVGDVVSAGSGGTFGGAISMSSTLAVSGATTLTGASEAAAEKMSLSSGGNLTVSGTAVANTDTDTSNTGTVDLDFGTKQNFVLTLTGNITSLTASNEQVGQSGFIVFIQDGTGSRTVSLHGDYETAGGAGITLTATASATDIVPYVVAASSRILLGAPQLAFS